MACKYDERLDDRTQDEIAADQEARLEAGLDEDDDYALEDWASEHSTRWSL